MTPLSLGVETQGGIFTRIIDRNTTIPTTKSQVFSTTEDDQDVVRIHVLQGERELASDNMTLGRFELVGIPPAPRGVPQIEVTYAIDADGVAQVTAKDLGTGRGQGIRVTAGSGLSAKEVDALVHEAADRVEADQRRRQWIDLCNRCDGLVYSTQRTLEEFASEIAEADRQSVEEALEKVASSVDCGDFESLRAAMEDLSNRAHAVTERLYAHLDGQAEA